MIGTRYKKVPRGKRLEPASAKKAKNEHSHKRLGQLGKTPRKKTRERVKNNKVGEEERKKIKASQRVEYLFADLRVSAQQYISQALRRSKREQKGETGKGTMLARE